MEQMRFSSDEALHGSDHHRTGCGRFFRLLSVLQACYTQGATYDEAIANIKDAIRLHVEDRQADQEELIEEKSVSLSTVDISL
jgi:predicted RNase H-like HicB family nuclease